MDSEPATVKQFLKNYWRGANEIFHEYSLNSSKTDALIAKKKMQGLKQMAEGFLRFTACSYREQSLNMDSIFESLASWVDIRDIDIRLLLGFSIKQYIMEQKNFKAIEDKLKTIQNDFSQCKTTVSCKQSQQQFEISFESDDDDPQSSASNYYAITKSDKKDQMADDDNNDDDDDDISILEFANQNEENYNDDDIKNQSQEIKEYLYRLSKATTQLSYLCQRMKWSQPTYIEEKSKISEVLFSCRAEVYVPIKQRQKFVAFTSECLGAVSKKQARRVASLFILRKLYNRLPEAWNKFNQLKRKNKGIQQQLNVKNEEIFKKVIKNQMLHLQKMSLLKDKKQNTEESQISHQINAYLDKLASCKTQINLLQGQYKQISPLQIEREKQDELSLWPVKLILYDNKVRLQAEARQVSKKGAQQKCSRELLYQLYMRDITRWRSFKAFKETKKL